MDTINFPINFKFAIKESKKSVMDARVGACLVLGKNVLKGYNKLKTHPRYANPLIHDRLSIHAELDCLNKAPITEGATIYVYREVHGVPSMSRPCEHCITFLKEAKIKDIYYSIPEHPYWKREVL